MSFGVISWIVFYVAEKTIQRHENISLLCRGTPSGHLNVLFSRLDLSDHKKNSFDVHLMFFLA